MIRLRSILGPRVPPVELDAHASRYLAPGLVLSLARLALIASIFVPFWRIAVHAPQYPDGLSVSVYVNHVAGDVREVDGLNHYIGMRALADAAPLERTVSIVALVTLVLMIEAAMHVHTRWAALFCLPAVVFPAVFLADLHYWLSAYGQHLDPNAPLSDAVKPFTPPIFGIGRIGQFSTVADPGPGLWLAGAAAVLTIAGLWLHKCAFEPLGLRRGAKVPETPVAA